MSGFRNNYLSAGVIYSRQVIAYRDCCLLLHCLHFCTALLDERVIADFGDQLPSSPTSLMTSPEEVVANSLKVTETPVDWGVVVVVVMVETELSPVAAAVTELVRLVRVELQEDVNDGMN